jgi:hypothetical protein
MYAVTRRAETSMSLRLLLNSSCATRRIDEKDPVVPAVVLGILIFFRLTGGVELMGPAACISRRCLPYRRAVGIVTTMTHPPIPATLSSALAIGGAVVEV